MLHVQLNNSAQCYMYIKLNNSAQCYIKLSSHKLGGGWVRLPDYWTQDACNRHFIRIEVHVPEVYMSACTCKLIMAFKRKEVCIQTTHCVIGLVSFAYLRFISLVSSL